MNFFTLWLLPPKRLPTKESIFKVRDKLFHKTHSLLQLRPKPFFRCSNLSVQLYKMRVHTVHDSPNALGCHFVWMEQQKHFPCTYGLSTGRHILSQIFGSILKLYVRGNCHCCPHHIKWELSILGGLCIAHVSIMHRWNAKTEHLKRSVLVNFSWTSPLQTGSDSGGQCWGLNLLHQL